MKKQTMVMLWIVLLLFIGIEVVNAQQLKRQDYVWARNTEGATITLDGVLDEPVWAKAESIIVKYGQSSGLPTSGWRSEFQGDAITDPTDAVVKFLVSGNQLYIAFDVKDSSVGGTPDWARWDAVLMSIKDKASSTRPLPPIEFFYTFWYVNVPQYATPGSPPRFIGKYGNFTDTTRTPEQRAVWDAGFRVIGGQTNDAGRDQGWIAEMRISVDSLGYDLTKTNGDIVQLNFSIWDCDYVYENNPSIVSASRTHVQNPWGNANGNNVLRVHASPSVTVNTLSLPEVAPDLTLQNGAQLADPIIDGELNDEVWSKVNSFNIAWGDSLIRDSYSGVGPFQSGQYQPEVSAGLRPDVLDPSYANVKMFFKGNYLYLAADINDQIVQGNGVYDMADGISLILADRNSFNDDNVYEFRLLRMSFGPDSLPKAYDNLQQLLDSTNSQFAVKLKGGTTVNNNTDIDEGYTVEMKIELTGMLGYPSGLGDQTLFGGVCLYDGDVFEDPLLNYGTRTWWFREHGGGPAAAWIYMDPNNLILSADDNGLSLIPNSLQLIGNYPNPFNPTTVIRYATPFAGEITLTVFNLLGESVASMNQVVTSSGNYEFNFNGSDLSSGVYLYKVSAKNSHTGKFVESSAGKMILMK
ncbi:MAG: T9SS type A sorting domain-containing protein [Ignavibacteriaceae bacterium]|nr:T9SS type A sorting domain-containing protein [Ignavibacteriaceae bacterium]